MTHFLRPCRSTVALTLALALGIAPAAARAQTGVIDRDGHPFRMPTVSPLESVYRLAPVHTDRDDRDLWIGLAELGDRWSFHLRHRPGERLQLSSAFHLKAASRFDLEDRANTFIEITYRVGVYLRARYGAVAARVELFHVSSHLGDEFLLSENIEPISTSREGVEFLVQVSPLAGLVIHGGPGWIVRSTLPFETPSVRFGTEWEPPGEGFTRPYAGVDLFAWSELDWRPQVSAEAGVALGRNARVGALAGFGPPRADQFLRDSETLLGISFSYRR